MTAPGFFDSGTVMYCFRGTHAFDTDAGVIFGFPCVCPSKWEGPLDECPRCDGRGFTLVDDGDGHLDELDCGLCGHRRDEDDMLKRLSGDYDCPEEKGRTP